MRNIKANMDLRETVPAPPQATKSVLQSALGLWERIEFDMTGPILPIVRGNMRIELLSALLYGPFFAALLFIPVVLQRMGADPNALALYQAQTYLGFVFSSLGVVFLRQRRVLAILAIIWVVGRGMFLLTPIWHSVAGLLVISALFWFADSFPSPAYVRVVQQIYPANVRGRVLSVVKLGMAVGMLLFTPLVGWVLDTFGVSVLFPAVAVVAIASALVFTRIKLVAEAPPVLKPGQRKSSPADLLDVLRRDRRFRRYLLSVVAFGLAGLIPIAFYPGILVDRLHLSYTDVSLLGTAQSLCWLLGYLVWGRIMDRLGSTRTMSIVCAILVIYPISFLVATSGWMLVPAYIASGLANAGIDLAFTGVTIDLADPDRVTEYAALQRTVLGLRGIIGPLLGVFLHNLGAPTAAIILFSTLLYLLAAVLMWHPSLNLRAKVRA